MHVVVDKNVREAKSQVIHVTLIANFRINVIFRVVTRNQPHHFQMFVLGDEECHTYHTLFNVSHGNLFEQREMCG